MNQTTNVDADSEIQNGTASTCTKTVTFGKHENANFDDVLRTDKQYCFDFLINFKENNNTSKVEKEFYDYLNSHYLCSKGTLTKIKDLIKSNNLEIPPSLIQDFYWEFAQAKVEPTVENKILGPKAGGKWMLFLDKMFVLPNVIQLNTRSKFKKNQFKSVKLNSDDKKTNSGNNSDNYNGDKKNDHDDSKDVVNENTGDDIDNDNDNDNDDDDGKMAVITELDQVWSKAVKLMAKGLLGNMGAKCSTGKSNPNARKDSTNGVIIIYTKDYRNKQDCLKVAQNIRKYFPQYKEPIRYKADYQTIQGKYSKNGQKSSIYIHTIDAPNKLQIV